MTENQSCQHMRGRLVVCVANIKKKCCHCEPINWQVNMFVYKDSNSQHTYKRCNNKKFGAPKKCTRSKRRGDEAASEVENTPQNDALPSNHYLFKQVCQRCLASITRNAAKSNQSTGRRHRTLNTNNKHRANQMMKRNWCSANCPDETTITSHCSSAKLRNHFNLDFI